MILLVSFSQCSHTDLVEASLKQKQCTCIKLNTDEMLESVFLNAEIYEGHLQGTLVTSGCEFPLHEISAIWWRTLNAPNIPNPNLDRNYQEWIRNETMLATKLILGSLNCQQVNNPDKLGTANNKLKQMLYAATQGFKVPSTFVSRDPNLIQSFANRSGNLVFKTFSHPTIVKDGRKHVVYTSRLANADLYDKSSLMLCMNYFQKEIKKAYELRVTVVGNKVFGTKLFSQESDIASVDWQRFDFPNTPHVPTELPANLAKACVQITEHFGLDCSTIDFTVDQGDNYWFLGMNPNGMWAWIQLLTGQKISDAIADLLLEKQKMGKNH